VEIVSLSAAQLPAVGALFAGSHGDYPPFRHLFPDTARRAQVLRRFFTATVRDALAFGAVDAAVADDGRLLGVAVWLPPGAFPWTARRKLRSAPMLVGVARAAPRSFPAFARMGANAERLHPTERHWNLETMGIAPAAQGQGIGSRLIAPGLARADAQRLACYLTTAGPRTSASTAGSAFRWWPRGWRWCRVARPPGGCADHRQTALREAGGHDRRVPTLGP
jgi:GNAT superfamily N-acetyltransferase